MNSLIVEDERTSLTILQKYLETYGTVCCAQNGLDALVQVQKALLSDNYFQLICLDIMMPEMDGQTALMKIRDLEEKCTLPSEKHAKIIMTSTFNDFNHIRKSYANLCDGYLVKPIDRIKLLLELRKLKLIE